MLKCSLGWMMRENDPMENSEKRKFASAVSADIPFLLTLGKPETQTLGGSVIGNFFRTIDIKEMAAIFQFFHNDRC